MARVSLCRDLMAVIVGLSKKCLFCLLIGFRRLRICLSVLDFLIVISWRDTEIDCLIFGNEHYVLCLVA